MGTIIVAVALFVEIGFIVWTFVSGVRHDEEKGIVRVGSLLLIGLLLLLGVLEGLFRYGMFAAILVFQIIISAFRLYRRKKEGKNVPVKKAKMVLAAVGAMFLYVSALMPAFFFPQYEEPKVTGTHEVATKEYTWVDEQRVETYTTTGENRELTVKFWYPKEEGSYPLVIFSHGAFGVIDSNHSTCLELASNGYVVVSIGHTYQSMFVRNTNGEMRIASQNFISQVYEENGTKDPEGEKIVYENSREWMKIRTGDENFVLDTILEKAKAGETEPFSEIDTEKIGLFGHSMGGATAVALGRERDDIDAVIDLEGTMMGEYVDFKDGTEVFNKEPYTVPVLDVNSSIIDEQAKELGNKYVNFYLGEQATDYQYVVIHGAGHLNFTDLPLVSPPLAGMLGVGEVDAKECIENINELVLQYFDIHLKDRDDIVINIEY